MEALLSRLASAEQNSGGDLQAAIAKASKYKKLSNRVDRKLDAARLELEDMSNTYQDRLRDQNLVEAEMLRM